MAGRQAQIARSIVYAVLTTREDGRPGRRLSLLARIWGFFRMYWLTFQLVRADVFRSLREFWAVDESDYRASFGGAWGRSASRRAARGELLQTLGDMGYSGSTFFRTADRTYLVKSVPRHFEHAFFKNDMLEPYADHVRANPGSLLVRITDFLECSQRSIGSLLGLAPSHHIIMENILYGQDEPLEEQEQEDEEGQRDEEEAGGRRRQEEERSSLLANGEAPGKTRESRERKKGRPKWESWDLKPTSYFYPERDVAGGSLTSEATKSRLADEFDGKIRLTLDQAEEFKAQLQKDTKLLADCNAVDYSLFLVRVQAEAAAEAGSEDQQKQQQGNSTEETTTAETAAQAQGEPSTASSAMEPESAEELPIPPSEPPFAPPGPPSWRTGVPSSDGREIYRAAVLDFFWSKHAAQARAMTGLVKAYNLIVDRSAGPMSVTAESSEYRDRFLRMCIGYVEVPGCPDWAEDALPQHAQEEQE
ncbi:hypothetical protein BX600DRAFT_435151 [Xylariales sp. PMI_506]|nr:hypothetical protein BX600DRAFT_435151 [Xylariales sp. PMI_506]